MTSLLSTKYILSVSDYLCSVNWYNLILSILNIVVPDPKPARTCIGAAKLPLDVNVEIEAIAAA